MIYSLVYSRLFTYTRFAIFYTNIYFLFSIAFCKQFFRTLEVLLGMFHDAFIYIGVCVRVELCHTCREMLTQKP